MAVCCSYQTQYCTASRSDIHKAHQRRPRAWLHGCMGSFMLPTHTWPRMNMTSCATTGSANDKDMEPRSPPRMLHSPAAKAAIFTGIYATIAGLLLALFPTQIFGLLFDHRDVTKGWIRVGGILFALIGLQYLGTGLGDRTRPDPSDATAAAATAISPVASPSTSQGCLSFYKATVWSRLMLAAGFCLVVAIGEAPTMLLVLAAINTLGAVSMAMAIRR